MSQVSRFRSSRYPSVPLICFLAVFCTCVARNPVDSSKTVSSNLTTTKKWPSITFPNQISNSIANCKANCQSIWTTKKSIKRKVKLFFFTTKSVRCNNLQNLTWRIAKHMVTQFLVQTKNGIYYVQSAAFRMNNISFTNLFFHLLVQNIAFG